MDGTSGHYPDIMCDAHHRDRPDRVGALGLITLPEQPRKMRGRGQSRIRIATSVVINGARQNKAFPPDN